ncbi:Hypothetical predicted protein [Olea europaea subsp. europaea]|uniref:Chlorophyll a-b binding protein, chloroplastic n=1 Tax=Olea europaea subsp. europaea TaxID=158383 RepID=A0A8S0T5Y6_OLEEU|nr:Hypothetical predicted protein [Olea europaea subsp. europaea]
MATQALLSSSSISSSAEVGRQILGGRPMQSSGKVSFVVKTATILPSSKEQIGPSRLHPSRVFTIWMAGATGVIAPEILGKAGPISSETALLWFKTGVIPSAGTYNY